MTDTAPTNEEPTLDIHKPKPWHGFREFFKEYLIIVVGVLTALGAEQAMENLHEQRISGEARQAILAELNVNVTNVSRRLHGERCVQSRLDEIEALLGEAGRTGTVPEINLVANPFNYAVYTQRWAAAMAAGRTSLLPTEEQRAIARVYDVLGRLDAAQQDEKRAWNKLRALKTMRRLSPEMVYDQRLAMVQARIAASNIVQDIDQARYYARGIGVKADAKLLDAPNVALSAPGDEKCSSLKVGPLAEPPQPHSRNPFDPMRTNERSVLPKLNN